MTDDRKNTPLNRRAVFAGAGAVGALAGAAALLPGVRAPEPTAGARPAPEKGGGYQLTQHVLRYYQTTRV